MMDLSAFAPAHTLSSETPLTRTSAEGRKSGRRFSSLPKCNRPFLGKCKTFLVQMNFYYHANKTHFHKKGFALGVVLRVRVFGTRKWPIHFRFYPSMSFWLFLPKPCAHAVVESSSMTSTDNLYKKCLLNTHSQAGLRTIFAEQR